MGKVLNSLFVLLLMSKAFEASLLNNIMKNVSKKGTGHSAKKSKPAKVSDSQRSPGKKSSRRLSQVPKKKKGKDFLEEIGVVQEKQKTNKVLNKLDKSIAKEMAENKKLVVKDKEIQKKAQEEKKRKLLLKKKSKKRRARQLKEKRQKNIRQRLLRKLDYLDTPAQVNKLKKIYQNYGIDYKKLNTPDLKFLVDNSKKLLQTYYNPQAMRS